VASYSAPLDNRQLTVHTDRSGSEASGWLLALRTPNQHLNESFGIHAGRHLDVRLDMVDAFDDVAVAMHHIALDGIRAIGNRLAAAELEEPNGSFVRFVSAISPGSQRP